MTEIESLCGFTWLQLALAGAVSLLLLAGAYRWMIAPLPPGRRVTLLAIRLAWTGMLLWCLFQPARRFEQKVEKTVHPHVVTLLDTSASMALPDASGRPSWPAVRDAAAALETVLRESKAGDVSRYALGESVRTYRDLPRPQDSQTRLISQLTQIVSQESRDVQPTVLFLLTDGQDTSETPANGLLGFLS